MNKARRSNQMSEPTITLVTSAAAAPAAAGRARGSPLLLYKMSRRFEFTARLRSFSYAGRGIFLTLASQHNAWIHAAATVAVVITGFYLKISRMEWGLVVLASAAVWTAEALNTAIEFLADAVTTERRPLIGDAKDVAAGAVLITALAAVIVGVLVFQPHIMALVRAK